MRRTRSRTYLGSDITFDGDINPQTTTAQSLGSTSYRWDSIWVEAVYGTARNWIIAMSLLGGN